MVNIRDRDHQHVAIEPERHQMVRQLINRGGRVALTGVQLPQEVVAMGHGAVVMHIRVAHVDAHGVIAMLLLDLRQALCHQCKRLVPADLFPALVNPLHRPAQALRIILDILQGNRLGADVAAAEGVLRVALD